MITNRECMRIGGLRFQETLARAFYLQYDASYHVLYSNKRCVMPTPHTPMSHRHHTTHIQWLTLKAQVSDSGNLLQQQSPINMHLTSLRSWSTFDTQVAMWVILWRNSSAILHHSTLTDTIIQQNIKQYTILTRGGFFWIVWIVLVYLHRWKHRRRWWSVCHYIWTTCTCGSTTRCSSTIWDGC